MSNHCDQSGIERREEMFNRKERFCGHFKRSLREYLARHESVAEGFGPVWECVLQEVPLNELDQAEVYWELIQWARGYELFTGPAIGHASGAAPERNAGTPVRGECSQARVSG
jgi:hypothetical protein